jgi:hypothetical protein
VQRGVAFDPKNDPAAVAAGDLIGSVERLFDRLDARGVDYVLVGGVAMLQYVDGRNTQDLDLIVALDELAAVPGVEETGDPNPARATFEGLQIDVLRAEHALFDEVRRKHSTERAFAERRIRCATVEGLLLLKLFALPSLYRQGRLTRAGIYESDIAALLHEQDPDLEPLFETLRSHLLETDIGELRAIVGEIRERADRFGQNAPPDESDDA